MTGVADSKLAVTYRPVAALIPYARSARTQSDAQVAEIAALMRAFGFTNPILVDGENGIIAGHGRLRRLGLRNRWRSLAFFPETAAEDTLCQDHL
jgi:hypothetical protein